MNVFTLSKSEIEQFINDREIIETVEQSFADYCSGKAILPPVTNLDIDDANGEVHIKSGHIKSYKNYCVKIASGFWDNNKKGLPSSYGMMILFNAETGALTGLLFDEGMLTDLRTAAAGAVASKYLAKKTVTAVGVIGTGVQARLQVKFLLEVRDFKTVYVWGRRKEAVEKYIEDMSNETPGVKIIACDSPADAAKSVDILITATIVKSPLISKSDLHPGMHITALGSDGPDKQEISTDVFTMVDKVVADHLGQCSGLGEIHHALDDNVITKEGVHAELGDIILGKCAGRENDEEITLCDLTGVAVQDIAISNWAVKKAKSKNLGNIMEIG